MYKKLLIFLNLIFFINQSAAFPALNITPAKIVIGGVVVTGVYIGYLIKKYRICLNPWCDLGTSHMHFFPMNNGPCEINCFEFNKGCNWKRLHHHFIP